MRHKLDELAATRKRLDFYTLLQQDPVAAVLQLEQEVLEDFRVSQSNWSLAENFNSGFFRCHPNPRVLQSYLESLKTSK